VLLFENLAFLKSY